MHFPIHDWQFWVAVIVFAAALRMAIRPCYHLTKTGPACRCAQNPTVCKPKKTKLTIEGKHS